MRRMHMTRKEMIRRLVALSVDDALAETHRYWLSEVFEKGFVGYGNFSDGQLDREMQLRGLVADAELTDAGAEDDDFDGLATTMPDFAISRRALD